MSLDAVANQLEPADERDSIDPPDPVLDGRLWIGGAPVDYAWARATGIDVVVDVSDPDMLVDPADLAGIDYRKCPLHDCADLPDPEQLGELVGHVVEQVRANKRVLVHCAWGRNRSGLVVALAVRDLVGVSGEQAATLVRERRRRALNNAAFSAHLDGLGPPKP